MPLTKSVGTLPNNQDGAALIEFAIALPVLAIIALGIVDVASCYSAQFSIEQAAGRALERVQVSGGRASSAAVRSEAARAANVPESSVTVEDWLECDAQRQAPSTQSCNAGQAAARYLQVTIDSSYVPFFGLSPLGARRDDGSVALSATSALRIS